MLTINKIMEFENVHGYLGEDGYSYLLIDDVAEELGYSRIQDIESLHPDLGAKIYHKESIRWDRINKYLAQYGYLPINRGQYVKEDIVMLLGIKANNEKAKRFHLKLINIIIPYFKQHVNINEYNNMIEENKRLKKENENLQCNYDILNESYGELKKLYNTFEDYHNKFIDPENVYHITIIAKDYGLSPQQLNEILVHLHIIYKCNGTYAINNRFSNLGYTKYKNNTLNSNKCLCWTELGIRFLHGVLAYYNIYPNIDNSKAIKTLLDNKINAVIVKAIR